MKWCEYGEYCWKQMMFKFALFINMAYVKSVNFIIANTYPKKINQINIASLKFWNRSIQNMIHRAQLTSNNKHKLSIFFLQMQTSNRTLKKRALNKIFSHLFSCRDFINKHKHYSTRTSHTSHRICVVWFIWNGTKCGMLRIAWIFMCNTLPFRQ